MVSVLPTKFSGLEQVAWEARIAICDDAASSDEEVSAEGGDQLAALLARGRSVNRAVVCGDWVNQVRWGDEDNDDNKWTLSLRRTPKRMRGEVAWVEPHNVTSSKVRRTQRTIPRAAHSMPALLHRFVSCDPTHREQLFFHRPRLSKAILECGWRLRRPREPFVEARKVYRRGVITQSWELRASAGELLMVEMSEELPSLVSNAGMASTLVRICRRSSERNDEDDGALEVELGENEPSPVIGAFEHGDYALCSDLYRAPLFIHDHTHIFLLILAPRKRSELRKARPAGKAPEGEEDAAVAGAEASLLEWTIRDLGRFAVSGQIEPRQAVSAPGKDKYKAIQEPLAAFAIARTLGKAAKVPELRSLCTVSSDELREALFKNVKVPLAVARRAVQTARSDLHHYAHSATRRTPPPPSSTDVGAAPAPSAAANDGLSGNLIRGGCLEADDLATRFSPEDVCSYESANFFTARLKELGLEHPPHALKDEIGAHMAVVALYDRFMAAKARADALRSKLISFATTADAAFEEIVVKPAEKRAQQLERELRVARRIHEELVFSPHNLTEGFVDAHVKDAQKIVLKLTGVGDPSGRGEACNFQRKRTKGASRNYDGYLRRLRELAAKQKEALAVRPDNRLADRHDDAVDLMEDASEPNHQQRHQLPAPDVQEAAPAPVSRQDDSDNDSLSDLEREIERVADEAKPARAALSDASEARELAKLREERAAAERVREEARHVEAAAAAASATSVRDRPRYAVRRVRRVVENGRERVFVDFDVAEAEVARVAKATGFVIPLPTAPRTDEDDVDDLVDDLGLEEEYKQMDQFWAGLEADLGKVAAPPSTTPLPAPGVDKVTDLAENNNARPASRPTNHRPPAPQSHPTNSSGGRGIGKSKLTLKLSRPQPSSGDSAKPTLKKPRARSTEQSTPAKINVSRLQRKHDEHKAQEKLKKHQRHREEAADYHRRSAKPSTAKKRRGPGSSARERQPHYRLAKILEDHVLLPLFRLPGSLPFHKPVNFPGYKEKIKQPIDLSTIRERLNRCVYRKRTDLLGALELMATNARTFNGPESPITKDAEFILQQARSASAEISDELDGLERESQELTALASSRRRPLNRKLPKPPQPPSHPPAPAWTQQSTSNHMQLTTTDAFSSSGEEEVLEDETALDQL